MSDISIVLPTRNNEDHIGDLLTSIFSQQVDLDLEVLILDSFARAQCGLRVFKANIVNKLTLTEKGMPFTTEMLAKAKFTGLRIHEAPICYRPRIGEAKLVPLKDGIKILYTILILVIDKIFKSSSARVS